MWRFISPAGLFALLVIVSQQSVQAQELVISGSSTVGHGLMLEHEAEVETRSAVPIQVNATGSGHGIRALFNGGADMAMISAPLGAVVSNLNAREPGSINGRELVAHQVGGNQVAFIVHPSNPVKTLTSQQLYDILNGTITSWAEVGGLPMRIDLLAEPPGGGVRSAVEYELSQWGDVLAIEHYVQSARMVPMAIAQTPAGLGITAVAHVTGQVAMMTTEETVVQPYYLVTRGQPDRRMNAVIEAARAVSGWSARVGGS